MALQFIVGQFVSDSKF